MFWSALWFESKINGIFTCRHSESEMEKNISKHKIGQIVKWLIKIWEMVFQSLKNMVISIQNNNT